MPLQYLQLLQSLVSFSPMIPSDLGDGHGLGKLEDERLEKEREAAEGRRPWHVRRPDAVLLTFHSGNPRMDERLVLEEVQVPPGPLLRVVDLALLAAAFFRTFERGASLEADGDCAAPERPVFRPGRS